MPQPDRIYAPGDEDHHHDGRGLHDAHGFLARFVDALDVVPPEINGDEDGETGRPKSRRDVQTQVDVVECFVAEADDILAGRNAADGPGENVIYHQRGDAELGKRSAHRLLY